MQLHDLNHWPTRLPCIRQIDSSDGESMCIAIAQASSRDQIAFNPDFFPGLLCTKTTQVSHLIAKISPGIDGFESYMFYFQRKKNIKKEVIWATFLLTSVINRENKSSTSSFAELGVPAILKFEPVLLKKKTRAQVLFCSKESTWASRPSLWPSQICCTCRSSQDLLRRTRTYRRLLLLFYVFSFYVLLTHNSNNVLFCRFFWIP